MQGIKNKIKKFITKIKENMKIKKIPILIISALIIASCITTLTIQTIRQEQIKQLEDKPLIEYEIKKKISEKEFEVLVKINSVEGIEQVTYVKPGTDKEVTINTYGKMTVGIDFKAEDRSDYQFKIKLKDKAETTETVRFEIPRIHGNYTLDDGIYVYEPLLTGYNENYTRYLNVSNGNLTPGNWISGEKPANWYNYKSSQWANIYVEQNGIETYYVWIPRYCFKLNQETERSDVKFINVYNEYIDESGNITAWEELEAQGYQVPEAFAFNNLEIPGYWITKYTTGESDIYTVNFEAIASKTKVKIKSVSTNTTTSIAKYTYAINGKILKTSTTPIDFEYEMDTSGNNIVNVTILDSNNVVIGSMTKECAQAKVNAPDLTGFDTKTTFYVTYDSSGNEFSTVPINQVAPEDWYDYADSKWANIVTRNDELETYYTWIPRYEFKLDQTAQRSNVNFLEGTSTQTTQGYQIPEAFTFNGKQIPGYWIMKYTIGAEAAPRFNTELVATDSSIRTKGIIGTAVATGQKYRYYIDGEYKGQNTSSSTSFEFTGLNSNTQYTILVEIRNSSTNAYIGTIVKQAKTIDANKPELIGFNPDVTYYVLYNSSGTETIGEKIKNDGSNMPSNWYDYSQSKWANIVVQNGTYKTYYTWIPRYEFKITSSQYAQPEAGRTDVRFIEGTSTQADEGYQIPEAFTFNGKQISGYWIMKYTVGE